MFLIALSAAIAGFVHSLSPGHWLPVVLLIKSQKWNLRQAVFGAILAASGHILISIAVGVVVALAGFKVLEPHLEWMESRTPWILIAVGVIYALGSRLFHHHCEEHGHHGPERGNKAPYVFLFTLGFSPCVAALPIFVTSLFNGGVGSLALSIVFFCGGVLSAFIGASLLVSHRRVKLDHPLFEHYGEVIAGVSIALIGLILLLSPHHH
jgi:ABC-type nickel/cobalt efflux system permease component RcnA